MENDLPNGFTGFNKREPGFESAAEALRRAKSRTDMQSSFSEHLPDDAAFAAWQADRRTIEQDDRRPAGSTQAVDDSLVATAQRNHLGGSYRGRDAFFPSDMQSYVSNDTVQLGSGASAFDLEKLKGIRPQDRRRAWVEVDLNALHQNTLAIRGILEPSTKIMAIVKADAYGHGAIECAKTFIRSGADYLGVATIDEGIELREAGITAPILIIAEPPTTAIPLLLAYDIMPSIYTVEFAVQYGEAADSVGLRAPYHLKVNTGMNRIGVRYDEVVDFLKRISFHRALDLVGTFTHFATADVTEAMEFRIQQNHFNEALDRMHDVGIDPGIVHAANSAATIRYPETHYDMVRCGICLYGFYPCPETYGVVDLIPAMSVHACITQVKSVPVGEGVSYGLLHRSGGFAKTCTVPIGYADGLRRGLSGRTDFIMDGNQFPQVGTISMDQCMFEVDLRTRRLAGGASSRFDPQIGDEVMIVGAEGNAVVSIDEMADKLYTVPHEITIGFGCSRMPRIYV